MKILIDMNLSPLWVRFFIENNIEAKHWSEIGFANARDQEIFDYARKNDFVIFTNDLDFGTILAISQQKKPSVIQARIQDLLPLSLGNRLLDLISTFESQLSDGSLIILDKNKLRIRILPL